MKCPECKASPHSLMHNLGFAGVKFTALLEGYFRCKNCGKLLKMSKTELGITKYEKTFWFIYPPLMIFFLAGVLLSLNTTDYFFPLIIGVLVLFIVIMSLLSNRYMVFEAAENIPEAGLNSPKKHGWTVFGLFSLTALLLPIGFLTYVDDYLRINGWVFIGAFFLYMLLIFIAGHKLIHRFKAGDAASDAGTK